LCFWRSARRSWSGGAAPLAATRDPGHSGAGNPPAAKDLTTTNADGTLGYEEDTVLQIPGRPEPFHHVDKNTLRKVAEPRPNPRAR
jgi:hypothetical protein